MRSSTQYRRRTRAISVYVALLACVLAAPVMAEDLPEDAVAPEERESPALRKPLPELSAPTEPAPDITEFSTEAPPPPPFDPSYQPPMSGAPEQGATK